MARLAIRLVYWNDLKKKVASHWGVKTRLMGRRAGMTLGRPFSPLDRSCMGIIT